MKNKFYDIAMIHMFLKDDDLYYTLVDYCNYLSIKYRETNEGKYRIKYNDLNAVLYNSLSDDKLVEFFNSFSVSLDIYPIVKFNHKGLQMKLI